MMTRNVLKYSFFFLACMLGMWGCSEGVPKALSLCRSNQDCNDGQVCISGVCVGQRALSQQETLDERSKEVSSEESSSETPADKAEPIVESKDDGGTQEDAGPADEANPVDEANPADETKSEPVADVGPEPVKETRPEQPADVPPECQEGRERVCYDGLKGTEGKGVCQTGTQQCVGGKWGKCNGQVLPQAEVCGDGRDNDCDGVPDENCPCNFDNKNVGVCKSAKTDGSGICQKPSGYDLQDICGDGLDNNCDGNKDETCQCAPKSTKPCGSDVGECKKGKQTCSSTGKWGPCIGGVQPKAKESCDGKDHTCNGIVDEGCPCDYDNKSEGVCAKAVRDKSGICVRPVDYLTTENCSDGKDNNCDGNINEGCLCNYLQKPRGVCVNQRRISNNVCPKPPDYSTVELCDGKDNDCDGFVDEGCPCNFLNKTKGVCATAKRDDRGACQTPANYSATSDSCADNLDNDCDGVANEGCQCRTGEKQKCGNDKGECKQGVQVCDSNGKWGACTGDIGPGTEVCDGKDNDCDGATDEGCPCKYLNNDKGVCATATNNNQGVCQKPTGYSTVELCGDFRDNNCNGKFEEGCPCIYKGLNAGVCVSSTKDDSGNCKKPTGYSDTEICGDNLDNNCDGVIDEGCPCNYLGLNAGVCKNSKKDGQGNCIKPTGYSATETCDKLDNDCDGQVDNFPVGSCYQAVSCILSSSVSDVASAAYCVASQYACDRNNKKYCKGFGPRYDCKTLVFATCSANQACPSACPKYKTKRVQCNTTSGYCGYRR